MRVSLIAHSSPTLGLFTDNINAAYSAAGTSLTFALAGYGWRKRHKLKRLLDAAAAGRLDDPEQQAELGVALHANPILAIRAEQDLDVRGEHAQADQLHEFAEQHAPNLPPREEIRVESHRSSTSTNSSGDRYFDATTGQLPQATVQLPESSRASLESLDIESGEPVQHGNRTGLLAMAREPRKTLSRYWNGSGKHEPEYQPVRRAPGAKPSSASKWWNLDIGHWSWNHGVKDGEKKLPRLPKEAFRR